MTPEQKRLNSYYLRKFGWTLAEVDALFASQGNVCAACGRPPGKKRMSLDHDHRFDRIALQIHKQDGVWWIEPKEQADIDFLRSIKAPTSAMGWLTRKKLRWAFRTILRKFSVRGGLCLRCNKGLAMFEDSKAPLLPAERLENLAKYLRKFASRSLSDKPNPGEVHEESNRHPDFVSPAVCDPK